jgi:hypothetical protein
MHYKLWFILAAGLLFCVSAAGYAAVKIFLRPKEGSELDEIYWEFEDKLPDLKRYNFWCRVFFVGVVISMLLMIVTISV